MSSGQLLSLLLSLFYNNYAIVCSLLTAILLKIREYNGCINNDVAVPFSNIEVS